MKLVVDVEGLYIWEWSGMFRLDGILYDTYAVRDIDRNIGLDGNVGQSEYAERHGNFFLHLHRNLCGEN